MSNSRPNYLTPDLVTRTKLKLDALDNLLVTRQTLLAHEQRGVLEEVIVNYVNGLSKLDPIHERGISVEEHIEILQRISNTRSAMGASGLSVEVMDGIIHTRLQALKDRTK